MDLSWRIKPGKSCMGLVMPILLLDAIAGGENYQLLLTDACLLRHLCSVGNFSLHHVPSRVYATQQESVRNSSFCSSGADQDS